jgi:phosphotransferase system  glucose/maltose/N-acetylglucosamine-specific IIC component
MASYLDETYLGGLLGSDITTTPTLDADPAPQQVVIVPETVTLPGGIVMPKQTFYVIALVVVAAAVYLYTKKQKRKDD